MAWWATTCLAGGWRSRGFLSELSHLRVRNEAGSTRTGSFASQSDPRLLIDYLESSDNSAAIDRKVNLIQGVRLCHECVEVDFSKLGHEPMTLIYPGRHSNWRRPGELRIGRGEREINPPKRGADGGTRNVAIRRIYDANLLNCSSCR